MFSSSPTSSQESLKVPFPIRRRGTIFQNEHQNMLGEKVIIKCIIILKQYIIIDNYRF